QPSAPFTCPVGARGSGARPCASPPSVLRTFATDRQMPSFLATSTGSRRRAEGGRRKAEGGIRQDRNGAARALGGFRLPPSAFRPQDWYRSCSRKAVFRCEAMARSATETHETLDNERNARHTRVGGVCVVGRVRWWRGRDGAGSQRRPVCPHRGEPGDD